MARGTLRIYLGAAPGVGKTYAMLNEGRRRRDRGTDVVVGLVEPHGRAATAAQVGDLDVVPPLVTASGVADLDVDAVLARRPEVVLVDELARTNAPGGRNQARWQDVEELRDAGIHVVTTLNVQHLASLADVFEEVTGIHERETIPDAVVRSADQVELVDMTEEALGRRLAHGNVFDTDELDAERLRFFRPGTLAALRELSLLWVADRVDERLHDYRRDRGIDAGWDTRERVVVTIAGSPTGEAVIRRAARIASRSHAALLGVHVGQPGRDPSIGSQAVEAQRNLLQELGGTYHEIVSRDVAGALVEFARGENATQLVLGATKRSRWSRVTSGSVINAVIASAGTIDVHVISPRDRPEVPAVRSTAGRRLPVLSPRRRLWGWVVALAGTGSLTAGLVPARGHVEQPSRFLLFQATVLVAAAIGGAGPAVVAALLATASLNWFFTPPFHTWTIDDPQNVLALVVFTGVGVLVAVLVNVLARSSADAHQSRSEAEALARVAGTLAGADDPLPAMVDRIRTTLGVPGVAVRGPDGSTIIATAGTVTPDECESIPLPGATLVVSGPITADDRRVLEAFAAQLVTALEHRRLRDEAATAAVVAEADALRTALLRAVSHDLRSPLASIKASVTSLQQGDIDWSAEARKEFLSTIDEETDRLDRVVANLLDASRLEAGVIVPILQPTALDDVVALALGSASAFSSPIEVELPASSPLVEADAGLLERALANLLANAAQASPDGIPVTVAVSASSTEVDIHIIDRGPGVATGDRERIFEPFQRLDDTGTGGVGLGLAVARGLVEAMHGRLRATDTPGGGLTMTVTMPRVLDAE